MDTERKRKEELEWYQRRYQEIINLHKSFQGDEDKGEDGGDRTLHVAILNKTIASAYIRIMKIDGKISD